MSGFCFCLFCRVVCFCCFHLWGFGDLWCALVVWVWVVGCWLLVVVGGCWWLVVGGWLLVVGCWWLVVGGWWLVVDCWWLVICGWWFVDVGWRLVVGVRCVRCRLC